MSYIVDEDASVKTAPSGVLGGDLGLQRPGLGRSRGRARGGAAGWGRGRGKEPVPGIWKYVTLFFTRETVIS